MKCNKYVLELIYILNILLFIIINSLPCSESFKTSFNLFLILCVQIIIFFIFKLDIISGITFLTTFTILPSYLYLFNPLEGYGDLALGIVPIFLYKYTFYVFIFIITLSFSAYIFNLNIFERLIINKPLLKPSHISMTVNNIVAIIFSIIAFPSIPQFHEVAFTHMLLPGTAWNQLAVVALLFNLAYLFKGNKWVIVTYLVTFIWFISHGERADMAGLILGVIIIILLSSKVKSYYKLISAFVGFGITILFISIKSGLNFLQSIKQIITFTTVSDISYSFNATIYYIHNFGHTGGKVLFNIIKSVIPLVHGSASVESVINQVYPYPGGASIMSAPLMDFGAIGIIIFSLICSYLLVLIFHRYNSILFRYEAFILIWSIPRISWYGINYVFTSVIFFVPFMYLLDKIIDNNVNESGLS